MVLLKNGKDQNKPFLPLAKDAKRILVAGTHADDIGYQCGGWTIAWHGDSGKITLGKQGLCFAKINILYLLVLCTRINQLFDLDDTVVLLENIVQLSIV